MSEFINENATNIGEDRPELDGAVATPVTDSVGDESDAINTNEGDIPQREEYEELIRTKYKQFYTEDTQKLINRRFKKYKAMEARVSELEYECEDLRSMINSEYERGRREAEENILSSLRSGALRPTENGVVSQRSSRGKDVSRLTRTERAELARRALMGESVKI